MILLQETTHIIQEEAIAHPATPEAAIQVAEAPDHQVLPHQEEEAPEEALALHQAEDNKFS